ncbi:uncharacterized protein E0L32_010025 [Thyridium curvatum]|uniref:Uncharacterized protein n=1 Tax=Thyridium curvatum TaxID=1093900 RepID=A0A507AUK1_9PEZI|nr:uncharacterized protein E0L32_010025 [Thyridium curvatum]TPX08538.1 hypothetical protein E0L32_010025 [Thyridium curvatum]
MATMVSETQHIRVESNRSESVTLDLLNKAMNRQTELFADLSNDLDGIVSRNIRKELRQAFPDLSDARAGSSRKASHAVGTLERESRTEANTSDLQRPARQSRLESEWTSQWRKVSSTSTRRTFSRISLFGKIIITTTTTTYSGNVSLDVQKSQKEVSHTTVVYVPAFWMFGTGVILKYITGKLMGEISQPKPAFSMRTINVIPEKSEIVTACKALDLAAIRSLFDLGRASPFDVSEDGRNLLHYTIASNSTAYRWAPRAVAQEGLKKMVAIVDQFLDAGVDGGTLDDEDLSAIGALLDNFREDFELIEALSDDFQFLTHRVLRYAEQDPFCACSALIKVTREGDYGAESFPGSLGRWQDNIYYSYLVHPVILRAILSQSDWLLSWDERQLQELCNILPCSEVVGFGFCEWKETEKMRLKFLVISHAKELQSHLDSKTKLLRLLLDHGVFSTTAELGRSLYIDAIHTTIHSGGSAFSLLTEHDYYGKEPPWIRQKFQKLLHIRAFMLDTLTIILDALWSVSPKNDDPHWKEFAQHAQSHNLRILNVCMTALRNSKYQTSDTGFAIDSDSGGNDDRPNHQHTGDDEGWETEHSSSEEDGWETEEDWQEGYMLDKAVDRDHLDDRNMQMQRCEACQNDFDDSCWEHVLSRTQEPSKTVADHKQGHGTISKVFNAAKRVAGF